MAKRGNRPKDPADTMGGVRGTHGLGDLPREREKRDRQVALRTSNWDKNATPHHHPEIDEGTGEELEFEVSNAMGDLESSDQRAAKREHDAAEAAAELDDESVLEAEEERVERNLASEVVPGPGPKDRSAGRATKQQLDTHGLGRGKR